MEAHLEPVVGILRLYEDGKTFGDEYVWSATLKWVDSETVEICGVDKTVTVEIWKTVRDFFSSNLVQVKYIVIKRRGKYKKFLNKGYNSGKS